MDRVCKSESEWRELLTPEQFEVTRKKGTERAFTGEYYNHKERGVYHCICCNAKLFDSKDKFDSKTGWPSFFEPISKDGVKIEIDRSYAMEREEVLCSKCDAHLGHRFEDAPSFHRYRYCINSIALKFKEKN